MINEINQRSISSVFFLNDSGVMMRHALIPRPREDGFLTSGMILQTLRQINHDRRHALSLLREAVECKTLDPLAIAGAFAQPAAACAVKADTLEQAADLAGFAGLHTNRLNGQITLSRDVLPPDKCAVHVAALPGFVRGWVTLDDSSRATGAWSVMPASIRELLKNVRIKPYKVLEQVNTMNQTAELVRFTYTKRQMVASASVFPTDEPVSVEQFKIFAEALLHFAPSEKSAPPLAKAG